MANTATANSVAINARTGINETGGTERNDNWWLEPLLTLMVLGSFGVYATWAAFQGDFYHLEDIARFGENARPYLSPFYSPDLPHWFPDLFGWWPFSPAILILPFPLAFRATCYYYRKAYYRSFFTTPAACAVGGQPSPLALLLGQGKKDGSTSGYTGETLFPMVLQNLHRYAFYFAMLFMFILTYDALKALFGWEELAAGTGKEGKFHVGVGSIVLVLNATFLWLYTLSCHSWRHILAGKLDCFSCSDFTNTRYNAWKRQSTLNEYHMQFAWVSLIWVAFSDIYVRLCSMGIWQDIILF